MKRKGFTLVELLGVIVILAILSLIAVPQVIRLINSSKKGAFMDSATGLLEAAEIYNSEHAGEVTTLNLANESELRKLKFKGTPPDGGTLIINENGETSLHMYNKEWCAIKNIFDKDVDVIENKNSTICNSIISLAKHDFYDLTNNSDNKINGKKPEGNEDGSIHFSSINNEINNIVVPNILETDYSSNFTLGIEFSTSLTSGVQNLLMSHMNDTNGFFIGNNGPNLIIDIGGSTSRTTLSLPQSGRYVLLLANTVDSSYINGYILIEKNTEKVIQIGKNFFRLDLLNSGIQATNREIQVGADILKTTSNGIMQSKEDKRFYSFMVGNEKINDKQFRTILENYYGLKNLANNIDLTSIGGKVGK